MDKQLGCVIGLNPSLSTILEPTFAVVKHPMTIEGYKVAVIQGDHRPDVGNTQFPALIFGFVKNNGRVSNSIYRGYS